MGTGDDATFGPGASHGAGWDQFETNKKMFGVTTSFDEDLYTTKIDRTAADFKEKERKAQALADEIMGVRFLLVSCIFI
jgi:PAB1-binding protein PBP1